MPDPRPPLFRSRLDAGEALHLARPLGPIEPPDVLLLVASDGAVEVAWPWAYLCGLPTLRLAPGDPATGAARATGQAAVLVDDGLLAADALDRVLRALRAARPRILTVVAPALRASARRACAAAGAPNLRTLVDLPLADGGRPLYAQQPVRRAVAASLLAEIAADRRPDFAPPLRAVG